MIYMKALWFVLLLLTCRFAYCQDKTSSTAGKKIALKATKLLDVRKGTLLLDPVVLIENGRILSVSSQAKVSEGFSVVDLGDVTLLPGLIDCHTHLLHHYDRDNPDALVESARKTTAMRALMGTVLAGVMLKAGFTTVRDLGNCGMNGDVALRDAINMGYVLGPRMVVATRALAPVGGQFRALTLKAMPLVGHEYREINGAEEARKAVREAVYEGANCIKVIANAGQQYLSIEELRAIVEEAHRLGLKVAAHATGGQAVGNCIEAGVNSIEHGYDLSDDELKKMAQKKIFLVPTDEPGIADQQKRLGRAIRAGVPIAAGADQYSSTRALGNTDPEQNGLRLRGSNSLVIFKAYVASGMTPLQAIQAGTIHAGELLGFSNFIGSVIEPGKVADIIAVQGDVLNDISVLEKVGFVMKEGQVYLNNYAR